MLRIIPTVKDAGYLTKDQLQIVATWKSARSAGHIRKNDEAFVREITGFALNTSSERARVETLTVLNGVSWPTASVILHLFHQDKYPILDFRALWSVQQAMPNQYSFEFWWEFVSYTRQLSIEANVAMRPLDRALWQYSKANQPSGS